MKRAAVIASTLLTAAAVVLAPVAVAKPNPKPVMLTSEQLTAVGFPTTPNIIGWGGTANLSTHTAAPWVDAIMTGKAPDYAPIGQILTMERFYAADAKGSGTFKSLNITTVVRPDHSFALHFQLGYPGTWGYRVGYSTTGQSPEFVGFQFQFTTTGKATGAPEAKSKAVILTAKQLERAGFTKQANVTGWGGTATLSRHKAPAGVMITMSGKAPSSVPAGTLLTLSRFVATDKLGSGVFVPLQFTTVVQADGSFSMTFELNEPGLFGYAIGAPIGQEYAGIEFQVKTT